MPRLADLLAPAWPILFALAAIFVVAAPAGGGLSQWPSPNLPFIVFALWCARRPSAVAPLTIFVLSLMNEALRDGPLGIETLGVLIATAALRARPGAAALRPFWLEWLLFSVAATALEIGVWVALTATLADAPALSASLERAAATILFYPVLAWLALRLTGLGRQKRDYAYA